MTFLLKATLLCAVLSLLGGCGAATDAEPAPRALANRAYGATATSSDDAYRSLVQQVYMGYFGRPADPGGLAYYSESFRQASAPTTLAALIQAYGSNPTVHDLVDSFGNSAESRDLYPGNNDVFITEIYRNLFNRDPDAAGRAYWVDNLNQRRMTRANAVLVIMAGALQGDAALIDTKTLVASAFTAALDTPLRMQGYNGDAAVAQVRTFMRGVGAGTTADSFQAPISTLVDSLGNLVVAQVSPRISAAGSNAMLLYPDGSLYLWGNGSHGALGNGAMADRLAPAALQGKFVQLASGNNVGYGIKGDGSLWSWGWNQFGQLGDGSTVDSLVPKRIGSGFTSLSASSLGHVLALKADRTLWTWGANSRGQIGNGQTTDVTIPTLVGHGFTAVATGYDFSLALKADGSLWSWGHNDNGQLGVSGVHHAPTKVGDGFSAIAAGGSHALALKPDGSLWSWGSDDRGQLGTTHLGGSNLPVQVGTGYTAIAAGNAHSLALKGDGSLWAWGQNTDGQLGNGGPANSYEPIKIGDGFTAVAAGSAFSMALKADGSVWTWGDNDLGQLGTGNTTDSNIPKRIMAGNGAAIDTPLIISGVVAVGDFFGGADMVVSDLDGELLKTVSSADGTYGGIVPARRKIRQPIKVEAKARVNGQDIVYTSISADHFFGKVTINVTPTSDLIRKIYDAVSGANGGTSLPAALLSDIKSFVKRKYGALYPPSVNDPISDKFVPDGRSEYDRFLDRHRITYRDRGYRIADIQGRTMAEGTLDNVTTGAGITSAAAELAIASRDALPIGGNMLRNEANSNIPGAARVTAVTPGTAQLGQPLNVVVRGENLGAAYGLLMSMDGCATGIYPAGGTETSKTFVCTPLAVGTKTGRVYVAASMRELYAFTVVVAGPPPKLIDYQPRTALLGSRTLFTLTGTDFSAGMTFALEGCAGVQEEGVGTAIQRWFSCVPGQAGVKGGSLRDTAGASAGPLSITVTAPTPVVSSYSPRSATANKFTEFVFTGTNMEGPMDFALEGCSGYRDLGGTATRRTMGCIPGKTGVMTGFLNEMVFGKALIELQVEVLAVDAKPSLTTFSPISADQHSLMTLTLNGVNLPDTLTLSYSGCDGLKALAGGSSSQRSFTCTPTVAGTLSINVQGAGVNLGTISIMVFEGANKPIVSGYSPTAAQLNQLTTFTFTGTGLTAGMSMSLPDCVGITELSGGTSTTRKFSCTPTIAGDIKGEIKDKLNGVVLKSFSVNVSLAPNLQCVSGLEVYCYYLDKLGRRLRHGKYEQYVAAGHLLRRHFYQDGLKTGPYEGYDEIVPGVLLEEGQYLNDEHVGTARAYFASRIGKASLGKLDSEFTFDTFRGPGPSSGKSVEKERKFYCNYESYVRPEKRGKLHGTIYTDMSTGEKKVNYVYRNGCSATD